ALLALQGVEELEDLGRRAGPGDRHDAVVAAAGRVLAPGERVGLAQPERLAPGRVRLRHEPRGPAPHDGDALTCLREDLRAPGRELRGAAPHLGLAGDLCAHVGRSHGAEYLSAMQRPTGAGRA